MAISYFMSTDASAPTLTGQVSSLINLLDACLVTGYGSKTALGWTKPYTGTNKAAFRMATGAGKNGHYLRVLDDGSCSDGAARTATITGFTAMTTVDTGTDEFPMSFQRFNAAGLLVTKSTTLDAVARPWLLVGDDTFFYFYCWSEQTTFDSNTSGGSPRVGDMAFGQFDSRAAGDIYDTVIWARNNDTYNGVTYQSGNRNPIGAAFSLTSTRLYIARDVFGWSVSKIGVLSNTGAYSNSSNFCGGASDQIDPVTGKMGIAPNVIKEVSPYNNIGLVRGTFPLLFVFEGPATNPSSSMYVRYMDIIEGTGAFAGKNFIVISQITNSTSYACLLQISGDRFIANI